MGLMVLAAVSIAFEAHPLILAAEPVRFLAPSMCERATTVKDEWQCRLESLGPLRDLPNGRPCLTAPSRNDIGAARNDLIESGYLPL
jgi:hypothetical protein